MCRTDRARCWWSTENGIASRTNFQLSRRRQNRSKRDAAETDEDDSGSLKVTWAREEQAVSNRPGQLV